MSKKKKRSLCRKAGQLYVPEKNNAVVYPVSSHGIYCVAEILSYFQRILYFSVSI